MRIIGVETLRTVLQPNLCIVILHGANGEIGLGESFWGSQAVEAYIHESAAPVLLASEESAPQKVAHLLQPYVGYAGSGAENRGNGAIDIALWDLLGRTSGLSVAELLGGPVQRNLRLYNTCAGYDYIKSENQQSSANWGLPTSDTTRPYDDLDGFLNRPEELAVSLVNEGYTALKVWPFDRAAETSNGLHVSLRDLQPGLDVLSKLRSASEGRLDILVEMHGQWSLKAATVILNAIEEYEPYWVEDPIRGDSVDAYQRLKERTNVPIGAGETVVGRRGFAPLLNAGALDVAIVDVGWTGGITEAVKIASLADAHQVPFATHDCTGPISFAAACQVTAAQPNGLIAESVRAFHASWYPMIADGLPQPTGGRVDIGTPSGLGLTLRPDFLASDGLVRRHTGSIAR